LLESREVLRSRVISDWMARSEDTSLSWEENTGYDCAKFLVEYCLEHRQKLPAWHVHSQNPVGKENIERLLLNFQRFNR